MNIYICFILMTQFVFPVIGETEHSYTAGPATVAHHWGEVTPSVSQCVGKLD